jgi:hypothetical protein
VTARSQPAPQPADSLPIVAGLLVLSIAFGATYVRDSPPAPRPADAPASEFSAARARDVLHALVGDGRPHPVGSPANADVRARIIRAFTGLGYAPEVQTAFACTGSGPTCATVNNIVVARQGREAGPAVLVATHYDSVAAGPGASDAGVSVASVLEIARALAGEPPATNPIVFLVDDAEEAGLIGASAFVAEHPLAAGVGVVVNLEARGTSGPSLMFETSGDNGWLVERLARSLPRPVASSLYYPVYERLPNDTDLTVFKAAGVPGVNFAFIGGGSQYHTPLDSVANASPRSLQHQGENALAIVRALAEADLSSPPDGSVVFFSVLGAWIVSWPAGLTMALAVVALLLVGTAALLLRRAGAPLWRGIVGLAAWILALGLSALGGWGLLRQMTALGAWPGGATTRPALAVLAFWALGLALATLVSVVFRRWTRVAGAWTGCWLGWSIAGIAVANLAPEASYVFIVPALVAGVAGLAGAVFRREGPGAVAAALPMAAAAVLIMPSAWLLFEALGPPTLPVAASAIALVASGLGPLAARAGAVRWAVPLLALASAGTFSGLSLRAPAFSPESPERMNIVFFQEAGAPGARWMVAPRSGRLPRALGAAAPFGDEREAMYPWDAATGFVARVDRLPLEAPTVEFTAGAADAGGRVVRARLRSSRGAPVLLLMVPRDRATARSIGGLAMPPDRRSSQRTVSRPWRAVTVHAVAPEGVDIELAIAGDEALEGYLADLSYGLPPTGGPIAGARPDTAAPSGTGDVTVILRRIVF